MRIHIVAAMLLALLAPAASYAQTRGGLSVDGFAMGASARAEIYDPSSGMRWLLYAPADGGPGRLVPVALPAAGQNRRAPASHLPAAVIHAGDRIVLEEHTAVVDSHLEAVALSPAPAGGALQVRLTIGGHVVAAVALAKGRAQVGAPEVRP